MARARGRSARVRSPCERSGEPSFGEPSEPEHVEQLRGARRIVRSEPLLEVPDRLRGAGAHHLLDREHRREAATGPRVHEANLLAQAKDVRAAERATKDLDAAAARKVDRARDGEERRLPRAVRSEERPPLARLPSSRSPRGSALAFQMRMPAPDGDARQAERGRLTRNVSAAYTGLTD